MGFLLLWRAIRDMVSHPGVSATPMCFQSTPHLAYFHTRLNCHIPWSAVTVTEAGDQQILPLHQAPHPTLQRESTQFFHTTTSSAFPTASGNKYLLNEWMNKWIRECIRWSILQFLYLRLSYSWGIFFLSKRFLNALRLLDKWQK